MKLTSDPRSGRLEDLFWSSGWNFGLLTPSTTMGGSPTRWRHVGRWPFLGKWRTQWGVLGQVEKEAAGFLRRERNQNEKKRFYKDPKTTSFLASGLMKGSARGETGHLTHSTVDPGSSVTLTHASRMQSDPNQCPTHWHHRDVNPTSFAFWSTFGHVWPKVDFFTFFRISTRFRSPFFHIFYFVLFLIINY